MAILFIFTLRIFTRNLLREEIAEEILFVFYFDVWPGARTLALRLISQHTTQITVTAVPVLELSDDNLFCNTYIRHWSLPSFCHDYDLVSHPTYVVCVNFITVQGTYSLNSFPNDKFLRNLSWQFYLLSQFLPDICWERKSPKKYFLYFILMSGLGLEPWLFV